MIITTVGKYQIIPITCLNSNGSPYQLREALITEVDKVNQRIYCPDLGWIDWNLPVIGERRARKR